MNVLYRCGNCGGDVGEDDACPCYERIDLSPPGFLGDLAFIAIDADAVIASIARIEAANNAALGFGAMDDEAQDAFQWALTGGRRVA